jgi:5-methylcytosine-specific restriction endonuclease McrA
MAKRQKEWARKARFELMFKLGGACSVCGTDRDLDFDCIIPQGPAHHRDMDTSHRMSFYRRQHAEGNLQLLCRRNKCHSKKTVADLKRQQEKEENEPF